MFLERITFIGWLIFRDVENKKRIGRESFSKAAKNWPNRIPVKKPPQYAKVRTNHQLNSICWVCKMWKSLKNFLIKHFRMLKCSMQSNASFSIETKIQCERAEQRMWHINVNTLTRLHCKRSFWIERLALKRKNKVRQQAAIVLVVHLNAFEVSFLPKNPPKKKTHFFAIFVMLQ